jgi:hypothetical protein
MSGCRRDSLSGCMTRIAGVFVLIVVIAAAAELLLGAISHA